MAEPTPLNWKQLPSIPDMEGFAYPFAGTHRDVLIVAGGANFPDKRPWEGGTKVWYDTAFVLKNGDMQWRTGYKLPYPIGYGVSISTAEGIVCIGGSDKDRHYKDVFLLRWTGNGIETLPLPPLPKSCANACGAMLGNKIYVAGGLEKPDSSVALKTFWSFDMSKPEALWVELDPWPGPERMLATAAATDGSFFLFSGASLTTDADGKITREWLQDAYRYTPGNGWKKLSDLPRPAIAAPTPAPSLQANQIFILGGDDGKQVNATPDQHQGFPRDILAYDVSADSWSHHSDMPFSLVTTPSIMWQEKIIIPGGEKRPGIRSNEVWSAGHPPP